jgi:uncharacterized protein (UPF0332 family)
MIGKVAGLQISTIFYALFSVSPVAFLLKQKRSMKKHRPFDFIMN